MDPFQPESGEVERLKETLGLVIAEACSQSMARKMLQSELDALRLSLSPKSAVPPPPWVKAPTAVGAPAVAAMPAPSPAAEPAPSPAAEPELRVAPALVSTAPVKRALRVRMVHGAMLAALSPTDPIAIAVLQAALPPPGSSYLASKTGTGLTLASDGVLMCPVQQYLDAARGATAAAVRGAPMSAEADGGTAVWRTGEGGSGGVVGDSADALPASSGLRFSQGAAENKPRLFSVASQRGALAAGHGKALAIEGGGAFAEERARSSSEGMLDNPIHAARATAAVPVRAAAAPQAVPLRGKPAAPTASSAAALRKPAPPHQTGVMSPGSPSKHGVGSKLRASLGSSYRSMPVVGLNFDARVTRMWRNNAEELESEGSEEVEEEAARAGGTASDTDSDEHGGKSQMARPREETGAGRKGRRTSPVRGRLETAKRALNADRKLESAVRGRVLQAAEGQHRTAVPNVPAAPAAAQPAPGATPVVWPGIRQAAALLASGSPMRQAAVGNGDAEDDLLAALVAVRAKRCARGPNR
jgi:hypothetical protein